MKLRGGIFVLLCVIEISGAAQWIADHENITVCYKPEGCTLFDWGFTSDTAVELIRWWYQAPDSSQSKAIMVADTDTGDASYVEDDYKGRISRDSSNKAAMRFCQMKQSDKEGTYSVEVTLEGTGLLGTGYVDEITECAEVSTQTPCPTCIGDTLRLSSVSTMTLNAGRATDVRESATTHILSTSSKSITTADDDNNKDKKLAVWQIVLSTAGGILFLIFVVVISIVCLHKADKNHGKRRYNGHDQRHTHYHVNTNHQLDEQVRSPQQFTTAAHAPVSHTHVKQKQTVEHSAFGYPYQKTTDPDLLVAAGHQSVINISSKHDIRYPFSNITTRYIGYNTNHFGHNYNSMYEPKPDYDI